MSETERGEGREREEGSEMGNSFGCSASGERLVSAARDGDLVEAKMLLDCNPCLAKYSTFGGLNSPLHFAAAKGHNEVTPKKVKKGRSFLFLVFVFFLLTCLVFIVLDCGVIVGEWS